MYAGSSLPVWMFYFLILPMHAYHRAAEGLGASTGSLSMSGSTGMPGPSTTSSAVSAKTASLLKFLDRIPASALSHDCREQLMHVASSGDSQHADLRCIYLACNGDVDRFLEDLRSSEVLQRYQPQ
eukprot:TRINITY_DN1996_c0_g1_i8.p2 TRINITY_DN1996_c0_g1~~TRINITY_DN1996_c0_g1_i8.p2  ORF type:complete len:126 (-),score=12.66 TRINITY_DN1996_c0_g1_i8:281-658(-)